MIRYLRDEHGLFDNVQDYAGNYAADLADMANTARHSQVARFLRQECNDARAQSCAVLGVDVNASPVEIRRAYLEKARQAHPDKHNGDTVSEDFDSIHKAYEHLTLENGNGSQCNPAHSLNLMLELSSRISTFDATGATDPIEIDEDYFKARLIAVLLEYGDKGLDLCNVKKKWTQVWPNVDFPEHRKSSLSDFIRLKAGDVVDVVVPSDGKRSIRVIPKHCTQSQVARYAAERRGESS